MHLHALFRHLNRWTVLTLLGGGLLLLQAAWLVHAAPPRQSAEEGKAIFERLCASCHTIGGGDLAGPDLLGIAERRDPEWLEHWLAEPDVMLAQGDPIATELLRQYNNIPMPNQNLTLSEIDALLAYLGVAQPSLPSPQVQAAAVVGNARAGKDLFTGAARFANGGTACIACHDVAGLAAPGGGSLGLDLTGVVTRYGGEAGLSAVLGTIPFPTMLPIYTTRPLTPQEQADLVAFLQTADAAAPPNRTGRTLVQGILAFAALDVFLLLLFLWHRRLPQDRRRVLSRRAA